MVDADRLRVLTLELVEIESPTGDTAEVSRLYGSRLEEAGMDVGCSTSVSRGRRS